MEEQETQELNTQEEVQDAFSAKLAAIAKKREEYCAGLEALAQFLRTHPDCTLPDSTEFIQYIWSKDTFIEAVKHLGGRSEKKYSEYYASVIKSFGPLTYGVRISRDSVCERKVVGKKIVAAREAYMVPAEPAQEVDIIEWECSPILEPSDGSE